MAPGGAGELPGPVPFASPDPVRSPDIETIREIEERAFNAWPARRTVLTGGWLVRLSGSRSRRVNSINALAPFVPLAATLEAAAGLFARHRRPMTVRVTPLVPADDVAFLDAVGTVPVDPTLVMTAPLGRAVPPGPATVEERLTADWLDGFCRLAATGGEARPWPTATRPSVLAPRLAAIAPPAAFATVREDGEPVGYGRGVFERDAVGLFDVIVAETRRRRGHARAITGALLAWGVTRGATRAYLQMTEANEAASRLYGGFGFRGLYRYHYRIVRGDAPERGDRPGSPAGGSAA